MNTLIALYLVFSRIHATNGLQDLLRREPLKLVDGGEVQRTFLYIKDAIEAVVLMIVRILSLLFGLFM
jgi:nucleoside-diphosphate-sugar epimerase